MTTADSGGARAEVEVRHPRPEDVEGFADLHARVWHATYRGLMDETALAAVSVDAMRPMWYSVCRAYAEGTVPTDGRGVLVALVQGEPAGFLMHGPPRDADAPAQHQVWAMNVAPERWGTGVAQALVAQGLPGGPCYLWVAEGNARAIAFYRRQGFELDGTGQPEAQHGLRELRMVRRT